MDWLWVVAALISYFMKGLCGFANTLIFTSILSFSNSNALITPVELVLSYPTNIIIAWRERKGLSAKVIVPLSIVVVIGSVAGAFILKNGNPAIIKLLFGFMVVAISIEMLLREFHPRHSESSPALLTAIGIASGVMCGLFGVGAFLVAYMSRTTKNQSAFKGNICFVFMIEGTVRVITYICAGVITAQTALMSLQLAPLMIIGMVAGIALSKRISDHKVKLCAMVMLLLTGVSLIVTNVAKFMSGSIV